jgi:hypothetical protein
MSDFDVSVAPATVGELRRRLASMGQPWEVPDRYNDDDPLPQPPRGGQETEVGHVAGMRAIESSEDFEQHLRSVAPTNPFLVERWRELGMLPAEEASATPALTLSTGASEEWGVG